MRRTTRQKVFSDVLSKWTAGSRLRGVRGLHPDINTKKIIMNKWKLRSIAAVIAGIAANVIPTLLTDLSLSASHVMPAFGTGFYETPLVTLALSYRILFAAFGGWTAAILAPSQPMRHVGWLLTIGALVGVASVFGGWNMFPHWYLIAIVVGSTVATWVGGLGAKVESVETKVSLVS